MLTYLYAMLTDAPELAVLAYCSALWLSCRALAAGSESYSYAMYRRD